MTQKVNFKLAYNGETHKFASAFKDDELFTAITQHVDNVVNERPYELFWNDDESDVVLMTSADLATAIDYAMSMRKSPTGTPCLRLSIGQNGNTEVLVETEHQQSEEAVVDQSKDAAKVIEAAAKAIEAAAKDIEAAAKAIEAVAKDIEAAANDIEADHDVAAYVHRDTLPRIKDELLELFESMIDHSWTDDIRADMKYFFRMPAEKQKLQNKSFAWRIAMQLADFAGKAPAGLRKSLRLMSIHEPHELAELVMSDWFDRVVEERIALIRDKEDVTDKDEKVQAIEEAASDVNLLIDLHTVDKQNYYDDPEEEKKEKEEEFDPTIQYQEDANLSSEEQQAREYQKIEFMGALSDAMPTSKHAWKFCERMISQTAPPREKRPNESERLEESAKEWAELIQSINFVEDFKEFTGSDRHQKALLSEITAEVIRLLKRTQKNWENNEDQWLAWLRDVHSPRQDGVDYLLSSDWLKRLGVCFGRAETRSKLIEYSPTKLAARLIVASGTWSEVIAKGISSNRMKIVRSAEMEVLSEDEGTPMEPNTLSPLPQYLIDWADRQAVLILKKGLSKLSQVLPHLELIVPEVSALGVEDLAVRERELKIGEKALQLQKDIFERQVAAFQVKMDEFEEKFDQLEKRVEENEGKTDNGYIDKELKDMDERLKTLELNGTEKV